MLCWFEHHSDWHKKKQMKYQYKRKEEYVKNTDLSFFMIRSIKAIMNQLKSKLALVVRFKNFFKRNPNFFSQVGKEINPLRSITLEFWNVIEVWRKDRFTLHDFQKGGCIADQRREGMERK